MKTPPPANHRDIEYTITFLEMLERPTRPLAPAPPGRKLALMRVEAPTVSFYRYLYNTIGGPWLWYERRAMNDEALAEAINDPAAEIYVLYVGGTPAGMAEIDRRKAPTVDLPYFGLIPDFIGQGLGPYLLDCAIDIGWRDGAERMTVNTCSMDHASALGLYQKSGFTPVRQEIRTIVDPRDRGLFDLPSDQQAANRSLPNPG